MKKKTQKEKVIDILKEFGEISNFHAIETKLTIRLGAIIHTLREDGWDIETKMHGNECIYKLKGRPTRTVMDSIYNPETNSVTLVPKQVEI